jgi:hypothetical protein
MLVATHYIVHCSGMSLLSSLASSQASALSSWQLDLRCSVHTSANHCQQLLLCYMLPQYAQLYCSIACYIEHALWRDRH